MRWRERETERARRPAGTRGPGRRESSALLKLECDGLCMADGSGVDGRVPAIAWLGRRLAQRAQAERAGRGLELGCLRPQPPNHFSPPAPTTSILAARPVTRQGPLKHKRHQAQAGRPLLARRGSPRPPPTNVWMGEKRLSPSSANPAPCMRCCSRQHVCGRHTSSPGNARRRSLVDIQTGRPAAWRESSRRCPLALVACRLSPPGPAWSSMR